MAMVDKVGSGAMLGRYVNNNFTSFVLCYFDKSRLFLLEVEVFDCLPSHAPEVSFVVAAGIHGYHLAEKSTMQPLYCDQIY